LALKIQKAVQDGSAFKHPVGADFANTAALPDAPGLMSFNKAGGVSGVPSTN